MSPRIIQCSACETDFSTFMRTGETAKCRKCGAENVVLVDAAETVTDGPVETVRDPKTIVHGASQPSIAPEHDPLRDPSTATRVVPLEFRGSASEYFKIWIVNVALSLVTLGTYSAWVKVRTRRYFCGNTLIDGSAFEYLANPVAILKGRIVAVVVLALVGVTAQFFLPAYFILLAIVFLVLPWIMVFIMRTVEPQGHRSETYPGESEQRLSWSPAMTRRGFADAA